jgi:hypothetical protein
LGEHRHRGGVKAREAAAQMALGIALLGGTLGALARRQRGTLRDESEKIT